MKNVGSVRYGAFIFLGVGSGQKAWSRAGSLWTREETLIPQPPGVVISSQVRENRNRGREIESRSNDKLSGLDGWLMQKVPKARNHKELLKCEAIIFYIKPMCPEVLEAIKNSRFSQNNMVSIT